MGKKSKRIEVKFNEQKYEKPILVKKEDGLTLTDGNLELRGDFSELLPRIKQSNLEREIIVKAARIKGIKQAYIVDATAGLGEDSFILAAAGFKVRMYEYDPIIAALLRDALDRALEDERISHIALRMELVEGDSIEALKNIDERPDVILLDPMFPERQKSAMVKRKFQLLQQLESPCTDGKILLDAAMEAGARKIIIKRPAKGAYLAEREPDYSVGGKAIRYDCFVFAGR